VPISSRSGDESEEESPRHASRSIRVLSAHPVGDSVVLDRVPNRVLTEAISHVLSSVRFADTSDQRALEATLRVLLAPDHKLKGLFVSAREGRDASSAHILDDRSQRAASGGGAPDDAKRAPTASLSGSNSKPQPASTKPLTLEDFLRNQFSMGQLSLPLRPAHP